MARMVGGKSSRAQDFPYVAIISVKTRNGNAICGGAILSNLHVLTVAHCFNRALLTRDIIVTTGLDDIRNEGADRSPPQIHHVQTLAIHPDFNPKTHSYDVAVLTVRHLIA